MWNIFDIYTYYHEEYINKYIHINVEYINIYIFELLMWNREKYQT